MWPVEEPAKLRLWVGAVGSQEEKQVEEKEEGKQEEGQQEEGKQMEKQEVCDQLLLQVNPEETV